MNLIAQQQKAAHFLKLHDRSRILVLPNAWDVVSARIVEEAGFPAIATTAKRMSPPMMISSPIRRVRTNMSHSFLVRKSRLMGVSRGKLQVALFGSDVKTALQLPRFLATF